MCAAASPIAIVTGGSGGIGLACCHRLAARGLNVVIAYGKNDALAQSACDELRSRHGVEVRSVRGDLTFEETRTETVAAIFEEVDALGGQVTAFVHAAGFFHNELLQHHFDGAAATFDVYDQYQSIYPKAFVEIAEGCLQRMEAGGRMVAITNPGCNALQTPRVGYDMPGQGKATMEFIVRMYAIRLAKKGICVNSVSPAYTGLSMTRMWRRCRLVRCPAIQDRLARDRHGRVGQGAARNGSGRHGEGTAAARRQDALALTCAALGRA